MRNAHKSNEIIDLVAKLGSAKPSELVALQQLGLPKVERKVLMNRMNSILFNLCKSGKLTKNNGTVKIATAFTSKGSIPSPSKDTKKRGINSVLSPGARIVETQSTDNGYGESPSKIWARSTLGEIVGKTIGDAKTSALSLPGISWKGEIEWLDRCKNLKRVIGVEEEAEVIKAGDPIRKKLQAKYGRSLRYVPTSLQKVFLQPGKDKELVALRNSLKLKEGYGIVWLDLMGALNPLSLQLMLSVLACSPSKNEDSLFSHIWAQGKSGVFATTLAFTQPGPMLWDKYTEVGKCVTPTKLHQDKRLVKLNSLTAIMNRQFQETLTLQPNTYLAYRNTSEDKTMARPMCMLIWEVKEGSHPVEYPEVVLTPPQNK